MESILIILVVILVTWYFSKTPKEDNINLYLRIMNQRKDCKRYAYHCDNCIDNMFLS